jgi:hypothetical protein
VYMCVYIYTCMQLYTHTDCGSYICCSKYVLVQKEKNKELEAKARDMERKLNQEKALREVAETRVKALKKKIRVYEGATGTNHHTTSSTANANDTSMDLGYGAAGGGGGVSSVTRGDDESVGTHQTYDNKPP